MRSKGGDELGHPCSITFRDGLLAANDNKQFIMNSGAAHLS